MSYVCPSCGATEFEKRGERRVYARLPVESLEVDSWTGGDIEWDATEGGDEIIYCLGCDRELVEGDLHAGEA